VIRPEVLRRRLNKVDEYLAILEAIQTYPFEAFSANPERYGSAERFLQLSIEAFIDMGSHVIAELNLGTFNAASDIPAILEAQGHIDAALKEKWIRMIGFRNVLVHDYLDIDLDIVYDVLQNRLDDLRALRKVFARFL
jgi:uncharacterized protein YutE (UPF0331/DUF86 family)